MVKCPAAEVEVVEDRCRECEFAKEGLCDYPYSNRLAANIKEYRERGCGGGKEGGGL